MKKINLFFFGLFVATLLFSCNKSESDEITASTSETFTLGNNVSRAFIGTVVDENNNPLSGVAIEMNGVTTVTNAQGEYTLSNVTVKERFAYVKATKSGYINGSRAIATHQGINGVKKIMMLTRTVVATIPSGQTTVVSLPNNTVNVNFDGAFVKADGSNYNGNVKVCMNYLNPTASDVFDKMPGDLLGVREDGSFSAMKTYGMVAVELYSTNDQKLQLAPNHKATISMQIPSEMLTTAESTIPLWYFDEVDGLWKEQGFSTKVGNRYVGDVSHFTLWNNDWAYPVANLTITAKNFDGTPVQGVKVYITSDVIIEKHTNQPLNIFFGNTNANGILSNGVPTNSVLVVKAYSPEGILIKTETLPASSLMNRYVDVFIPAPNKN